MDFNIPRCISISESTSSQSGGEIYHKGSEAVRAIQQDLSLAFRFLVVTGTDISNYPLDRWFPAADQFLLHYFHFDNYLAALRDYAKFLNESALQEGVSILPRPFTSDTETILAYKTFFNTYGSHVITNASYGARFLMVNMSIVSESTLHSVITTLSESLGFEQSCWHQQ